MKRKRMVWEVALLCILIVGGSGLLRRLDVEGSGNRETEEEPSQWNGTGHLEHEDFARPNWKLMGLTIGKHKTLQRSPPIDNYDSFVLNRVTVRICYLQKESRNGTECPFCIDDHKLTEHIIHMDQEERLKLRIPETYGFGLFRCSFPYETDNDQCIKDHTTRAEENVKLSPEGQEPFFTRTITCPGSFDSKMYACRKKKFTYAHPILGNITVDGSEPTYYCSDYCVGILTPEVSLDNGTVQWKSDIQCPRKIVPECEALKSDASNVVSLGDNSYCFKKRHKVSSELKARFLEGDVELSRRCGDHEDCAPGYCLLKNINNGNIRICGQTDRTYSIPDPHPECYLKTADGSSLRITKDEWCCLAPDGCEAPVGQCNGKSDCHEKYCIGVRQSEDRYETWCPRLEKRETGWDECLKLRYGQTFRIEKENRWCCIPENDTGCNYQVRSCGSNLSCQKAYCIREKQTGETICPETDEEERCRCLHEGRERIFSPGRVCCKKPVCSAISNICGNDPNCDRKFCVAVKVQGSAGLSTSCPTEAERELLSPKCSNVPDGETLVVEKEKVWCCRRRHCNESAAKKYLTSTTVEDGVEVVSSTDSFVKINSSDGIKMEPTTRTAETTDGKLETIESRNKRTPSSPGSKFEFEVGSSSSSKFELTLRTTRGKASHGKAETTDGHQYPERTEEKIGKSDGETLATGIIIMVIGSSFMFLACIIAVISCRAPMAGKMRGGSSTGKESNTEDAGGPSAPPGDKFISFLEKRQFDDDNWRGGEGAAAERPEEAEKSTQGTEHSTVKTAGTEQHTTSLESSELPDKNATDRQDEEAGPWNPTSGRKPKGAEKSSQSTQHSTVKTAGTEIHTTSLESSQLPVKNATDRQDEKVEPSGTSFDYRMMEMDEISSSESSPGTAITESESKQKNSRLKGNRKPIENNVTDEGTASSRKERNEVTGEPSEIESSTTYGDTNKTEP